MRACPNRYNALPRGVLSSSETSHAALSSSDSAEPSQRIDVAPQLHPSRVRDYSRVSTELPKTAVLTGVGGLLAHVKIPGTAGIECLTMDGRRPQALSDSLSSRNKLNNPYAHAVVSPSRLARRQHLPPRRRRRNDDDLLSGGVVVRARNVVAQTFGAQRSIVPTLWSSRR